MVQLVLSTCSDKHLIDYNFNIEMVMSSSTSFKMGGGFPLMILELKLGVNRDENGNHNGKAIQRVVVELDREEARDFMSRLSKIEQEIIQLNNDK
tara:strand:- start:66 stop:350 length:285 start_codon:yes stop_codon:yes gene_type:complete